MKKVVLVFSLLTLISCNKEDDVIYEVLPNARVVSVGIDCGDSYLIQFIDDFTELPQTINNTYYEINLPDEYKIDGIEIYVDYRMLEPDEALICTTLGPAYTVLYIISAQQ